MGILNNLYLARANYPDKPLLDVSGYVKYLRNADKLFVEDTSQPPIYNENTALADLASLILVPAIEGKFYFYRQSLVISRTANTIFEMYFGDIRIIKSSLFSANGTFSVPPFIVGVSLPVNTPITLKNVSGVQISIGAIVGGCYIPV